MKRYLLVKHELKPGNNSKYTYSTVREIAEKVATNIERIWLKSSIPATHKRVLGPTDHQDLSRQTHEAD